jgi:hypothetical protein
MDGPQFAFEVHIDSLIDQIPQIEGDSQVQGLVSTATEISIAGGTAESTDDSDTWICSTNTEWPGPVAVQILVVRRTQSRTVGHDPRNRWTLVLGRWRPADRTCRRRSLRHTGVARRAPDVGAGIRQFLHKPRIFEPPVPPGIVGTIDVVCDLVSERVGEIRGDVAIVEPLQQERDPPDNEMRVRRDLSPNGEFFLNFNITALNTRGFVRDVRPLFRDSDIAAMKQNSGPDSGTGLPAGFDLSSYDTVKTYAQQIFPLVSEPGSRTIMPCDWQTAPWARPGWGSGWSEGRILVFKQWMSQGMRP